MIWYRFNIKLTFLIFSGKRQAENTNKVMAIQSSILVGNDKMEVCEVNPIMNKERWKLICLAGFSAAPQKVQEGRSTSERRGVFTGGLLYFLIFWHATYHSKAKGIYTLNRKERMKLIIIVGIFGRELPLYLQRHLEVHQCNGTFYSRHKAYDSSYSLFLSILLKINSMATWFLCHITSKEWEVLRWYWSN